MRLRAGCRIRAAVRLSAATAISAGIQVRSAPGLLEPGIVGWFRPVLLLPAGVWYIGARLVEERERACDEEVLRTLADPKAYAEGILNVCKRYVESPLVCVSGVSGSDLKKRIEAIMANRIALNLNAVRKIALATAGVVALAMPIVVGVVNTPRIAAQAAEERLRFVQASIRPSQNRGDEGPSVSTSTPSGTKSKSKGKNLPPGTVSIGCATLGGDTGLIHQAYLVFATGRPIFMVPIPSLTEGPSWLDSEKFDIEARAEGDPKVSSCWAR
jgi:hypothetical protein